jgi:hypothetical protein
MLARITQISLGNVTRFAPIVGPVAIQAVSVRFVTRYMSSIHYAVDAPDGEHDLQDIVSSKVYN